MSVSWHAFVAPGSVWFVLPLAFLLGLALALRGPDARKAVFRWWTVIALAVALVAASKIAFYGWGTGIRAWDLTCFSGHTVLALAFWPVALALLVPPRRRRCRVTLASVGWVLAGLIGLSRVMLGAHPPSEVLAGAFLGGAAGACGLYVLRQRCWPAWPGTGIGVLCLLAGLWLHRSPPELPSERWLAEIGAKLAGRETPFTRWRWKVVKPSSFRANATLRG